MVTIMFVDGDLVPQSTSNMPNKHITIKFRFKFKQKSIAEAVSKEKRCISTILQPPFQPGNNIVQMPLQCDSSLFLSGFQLRQLRSTVSQSHHRRYSSKNKRKRCNASRKNKYNKNVYKTDSSGKSSMPWSIYDKVLYSVLRLSFGTDFYIFTSFAIALLLHLQLREGINNLFLSVENANSNSLAG